MGVPRFFIEILKKYRKTHVPYPNPDFTFEYLFMDFNAFIYPASREYLSNIDFDKFKKMTVSKREQAIADYVVKKTIEYVKYLNPKKLLYIAIDGPAPRGKMKLQRSRRYKAIKKDKYFEILKKEFKVGDDKSTLWNTNSLSPGTTQMEKISKGLKMAAKKKKFGNIKVIIDDYSIPGEGEHKILKYIKQLNNPEDKLVVYSPDADMIILCLQYRGDIYNIRERDPKRKEDKELYPDDNVKDIIFSVKKYREALKEELNISKFSNNDDEFNLSRDVMFITFFIGNDFVKAIYYTKSNKRGFNAILDLYKECYHEEKSFLIIDVGGKPTISESFFYKYIKKLSDIEDSSMKIYYKGLLFKMDKKSVLDTEEKTFEKMKSNYEHEPYYSVNNPFSDIKVFKKINYNDPHKIWKKQYYSYFFKLKSEDFNEYKEYVKMVCNKYVKSLDYCLKYYLTGEPPSWDWYYPFMVSPMPSDILYFRDNLKNIKYEKGSPYYPFEQLTMILPPQSIDILPKMIRELIKKPDSALTPYYPINFELEKVSGEKFIYSYAILPQFIDDIVRPLVKSTFTSLTKSEKERNILNEVPTIY